MPCHAAMTDTFITALETETVERLLKRMNKASVTAATITDENGKLTGLFSLKNLLRNASPVSVSMGGTMSSNITLQSAPGIAKRMQKIKPLTAREFMLTKFQIVYPETPTWEGLKILLDQDEPLVVIDRDSQKPLGLVTEMSIMDELERMQE